MNATKEQNAVETKIEITATDLQKLIAEEVAKVVAQRTDHAQNTMTATQLNEKVKADRKMLLKYCDEDEIDKLARQAENFESKKYREKDWDNCAFKAVHALGKNGKGKAVRMKGRTGRIVCTWAQVGSDLIVGFDGKPTFSFKEKLENKGFRMTKDGVFTCSIARYDTNSFVSLLPKYATDVYTVSIK